MLPERLYVCVRFVPAWMLLVMAMIFARSATAQPMLEHIPEDAIGFFTMAGADDPAVGFDDSITKKMLDGGMREIFWQKFDLLVESAKQRPGGEPQALSQVEAFVREAMPVMLKRPSFGYITGQLDMTKDRPKLLGRFVFAVDSKDVNERALINKWIDKAQAEQQQERQPMLDHGFEGREHLLPRQPKLQRIDTPDFVGLVINFPGTDELDDANTALKPAKTIAGHSGLQASYKQVSSDQTRAMLFVWADVARLFDMAMQASGDEIPAEQLMDALGIKNVNQFALAQGFNEAGLWFTDIFLDVPAPRQGMLAAYLETVSIQEANLAAIPRNATWMRAGTWDLPGVMRAMRDAQTKMPEETEFNLDQSLKQLHQVAGFDVEKTLIEGLGPLWMAYSDASTMTMFGPGINLINRTNKPKDVENALNALQILANAMFFNDPDAVMRFTRSNIAGMEMNVLNLMVVSPTWAMVDDHLVIGISPQSVSSFAVMLEQNDGGITANPDFRKVRATLPKDINALMYTNLSRTAPQMYQAVNSAVGMLVAADPQAAQEILAMLPSMEVMQPYLKPCGFAGWTDDAGWHYQDTQPFPGATYLSPEAVASQVLGMSGLGNIFVMVLPALYEARSVAQATTSATQMRGIGIACTAYAMDHRSYPDTLYTLYKGNYFTPDYILSPQAHESLPGDFETWDEKKQETWMRANASYVLIPVEFDDEATTTMMLFEKPDHSPLIKKDQIHITMMDGSTQVMPRIQAQAMVQAQTGKSMEQLITESEKPVE